MILPWILFALFMTLLSALFVGGLCACAGNSEREIERLQADNERMHRELDQL